MPLREEHTRDSLRAKGFPRACLPIPEAGKQAKTWPKGLSASR